MKGDRELCMAAVAKHSNAFEWVSAAMKRDEEVVLTAIKMRMQHTNDITSTLLWGWLSEDMKRNEKVRKRIGK